MFSSGHAAALAETAVYIREGADVEVDDVAVRAVQGLSLITSSHVLVSVFAHLLLGESLQGTRGNGQLSQWDKTFSDLHRLAGV